jgi:hypothetical protein
MDRWKVRFFFTITMAVIIAYFGTTAMVACRGGEKGIVKHGTFIATTTHATTVKPTVTSQTAQLLPPPTLSPLIPEKQNHFKSCILVYGGHITGTVMHAGRPAPDGTFVSLIFSGGPLQNTRVKDGRYSLPLLARECPDGLHWVGFQLWAGGKGQNVQSDDIDYHLNLDAPEIPTSVPPDTPSYELILGTVSGVVMKGGTLVPDGTVVSANTGPSKILDQAVFTTDGRYTLTTVGTRCDDEAIQFLQITLSSLGTSVTIIPTQELTIQDITIP